jgi:hypothetical protein
MRSRVRLPVLPWGLFLEGEDSRGEHGLGSLVELRFKTLWYFIFIYHHPPHRDNVTAPDGRPNLRSRLHFGHNQEGDHEVYMDVVFFIFLSLLSLFLSFLQQPVVEDSFYTKCDQSS